MSTWIFTFWEIPYGKYTVKETKAPKCYELDDTVIPFEILENGKTLTATKTDKQESLGFVVMRKTGPL